MKEKEFIIELEKKGIILTCNQIKQFSLYYETLIDYNKKINLTSIVDKDEVYLKHFYDSLSLLFVTNINNNSTLCDVGAGAGFPSIPLKIVRPDLNITIIDSLGKRILFLKHLISILKIKNVNAIHNRAEDYAKDNREKFDIVTARAVARLNILSELCIPLVKVNGNFIAMKAQGALEEVQEFKGFTNLGAKLTSIEKLELPFYGGSRNIIVFSKMEKTPNKYPRNYSKIKSKPL